MTENDLSIARDLGALHADMRTVKHDIVSISSKMDGLSVKFDQINTQQARGLGFFAGVVFILSGAAGFVLFIAKTLFGGHA